MSLRRTFAGYRTIAGQIPVVVAVNSPIHLIFDELDKTLEFRFSASPINEFCFVCFKRITFLIPFTRNGMYYE